MIDECFKFHNRHEVQCNRWCVNMTPQTTRLILTLRSLNWNEGYYSTGYRNSCIKKTNMSNTEQNGKRGCV